MLDTHVHLVSSDHERYPLKASPAAWVCEAPVDAERFVAEMAEAGVERAVLVQPLGAYGGDNSYAADSAARWPRRFASVCAVDHTGAGAAERVSEWIEQRGMNGVRLMAIPDASVLDEAHATPLAQRAERLGIPVVVAVMHAALPRLLAFLTRHPNLPVALDHCGFPDLTGGPPYSAARNVFELACFPNLTLELTSLVLETASHHGDSRRFVSCLVDYFGPQRIM